MRNLILVLTLMISSLAWADLPVGTCRDIAYQTAAKRMSNAITFAEDHPEFPEYQKYLGCKNKPLILEAESTHGDWMGNTHFVYRFSVTCDTFTERYEMTYYVGRNTHGCAWDGE